MQEPTSAESSRTVLVSGVFDMKNFGDLLFPHVADFRLEPFGYRVVPVAPTANPVGLADAMDCIDIRRMIDGRRAAAVLIGGGYIIHSHKMDLLEDYRVGDLSEWAGPGLWLGATLAAAVHDIPVAWNAPGVPHPLPQGHRGLVAAALRAADYVSVRDRGSAELLDAPEDVNLHVVPDTIADLARMWPAEALNREFTHLMSRKGADPGADYLAVHPRNRSIAGMEHAEIAARIEAFAREAGLCPLFVAVGRSHNDDKLAREVTRHLRTAHVLLDDPLSLKEIAAALAYSRLYVGASLHGYIAAAAYGVPGVLVARPAYRKFRGFLDHTGRYQDLARDWIEGLEVGAALLARKDRPRIPQGVFDALDAHWGRIRAAIANPSRRRRERRAFLDALALVRSGPSAPRWTREAFLSGARR